MLTLALVIIIPFQEYVVDFKGIDPDTLKLARKALGQPYKSGKVWSYDSAGGDCSGFAKGFVETLTRAHVPRTSSELYRNGYDF